jgi:hypothetical protein
MGNYFCIFISVMTFSQLLSRKVFTKVYKHLRCSFTFQSENLKKGYYFYMSVRIEF